VALSVQTFTFTFNYVKNKNARIANWPQTSAALRKSAALTSRAYEAAGPPPSAEADSDGGRVWNRTTTNGTALFSSLL